MTRQRTFTKEQIQLAKELREQNPNSFTKRRLADIFGVGVTTIWDNVYYDRRKPMPIRYRKLSIVREVVRLKKIQGGYNTLQVAQELNIPLKEVNHIWGKIIIT